MARRSIQRQDDRIQRGETERGELEDRIQRQDDRIQWLEYQRSVGVGLGFASAESHAPATAYNAIMQALAHQVSTDARWPADARARATRNAEVWSLAMREYRDIARDAAQQVKWWCWHAIDQQQQQQQQQQYSLDWVNDVLSACRHDRNAWRTKCRSVECADSIMHWRIVLIVLMKVAIIVLLIL